MLETPRKSGFNGPVRETGQAVGCLSYQHLQRPRDLDDEAWIYTLGRVGSLRYRALKKSRWVEDCLKYGRTMVPVAGHSLKTLFLPSATFFFGKLSKEVCRSKKLLQEVAHSDRMALLSASHAAVKSPYIGCAVKYYQ